MTGKGSPGFWYRFFNRSAQGALGCLSIPFFLGAALFAAAMLKAVRDPGNDTSVIIAFGVGLLVTGGIGVFLATIRTMFNQDLRDREAQALLDDALQQEGQTFFLYLRPFSTTGKIQSDNQRRSNIPVSPWYWSELPSVDLESRLLKALEPFGPLVGLGEGLGSAKVASPDASWKAQLATLASRAVGIVMIPLGSEGTLWEATWLLRQPALERTVFVMPPKASDLKIREYWDAAIDRYVEHGIHLPRYGSDGLLFKLGENGHIAASAEFPVSDKDLGRAVAKLCSLPSASGRLHDPRDTARARTPGDPDSSDWERVVTATTREDAEELKSIFAEHKLRSAVSEWKPAFLLSQDTIFLVLVHPDDLDAAKRLVEQSPNPPERE